MIRSVEQVLQFLAEHRIQMVDLRFVDLFGAWHHVTLPSGRVDKALFDKGVPFDGSSIPGFKRVQGGDLTLVPDVATCMIDPFWEQRTVAMICSIAEADTLQPYGGDPRTVASRAEALLKKLGIADESSWGPEFEFYIFDKINYPKRYQHGLLSHRLRRGHWNSGGRMRLQSRWKNSAQRRLSCDATLG